MQVVNLFEENDDLPPNTGTDKNYTEAFRIAVERNWRPRWLGSRPSCADAPNADVCASTAWFFGQQFYTPDDITVPTLIPDDRPYAGWLYVGAAYRVLQDDRATTTEVIVGVTGKPSLARQVQTGWHKLVGADKPQGWDHQVGTRLGVLVTREYRLAIDAERPSGNRWLEIAPYAGGAVGNIVTWAYSGVQAKVGYNLSRDWTQLGIKPRRHGSTRALVDPGKFEIYLVADMEGRAIAYNVFLEATKQHRLDTIPLVADAGVGIGVRFGRFAVSYRTAFIGPEYQRALTHTYRAARISIGAR